MPLIFDFLEAVELPYAILPHPPAFSAKDEAALCHVARGDWAKVVVFYIDGRPAQAVVPASCTVDTGRLLELAGGAEVRLAGEGDLRRLFPDCETGAMPPFGLLYNVPVYADARLAARRDIVFDGGSHSCAVIMRWADFARTVEPIVGNIAGNRRIAQPVRSVK
jgi:Ala-tRNA(Pro) deacylase